MRILRTAAIALAALAGIVAFSPAANAAPAPAGCHRVHAQSGPNYGLLNGTQLYAPVDLGLNVSDLALGLLGSATAGGDHNTTVSCGN